MLYNMIDNGDLCTERAGYQLKAGDFVAERAGYRLNRGSEKYAA